MALDFWGNTVYCVYIMTNNILLSISNTNLCILKYKSFYDPWLQQMKYVLYFFVTTKMIKSKYQYFFSSEQPTSFNAKIVCTIVDD